MGIGTLIGNLKTKITAKKDDYIQKRQIRLKEETEYQTSLASALKEERMKRIPLKAKMQVDKELKDELAGKPAKRSGLSGIVDNIRENARRQEREHTEKHTRQPASNNIFGGGFDMGGYSAPAPTRKSRKKPVQSGIFGGMIFSDTANNSNPFVPDLGTTTRTAKKHHRKAIKTTKHKR